jgi:hypothetical protein
MGKILKRCYICKWWDHENQIDVVRRDEEIEGYLGDDQAARCTFKPAPGTEWWRRGLTPFYTLCGYVCSCFEIRSIYCQEAADAVPREPDKGAMNLVDLIDTRKPECDICRKKVDQVVQFEDDPDEPDTVHVCRTCLAKAQKMLKAKKQ